MASDQAGQQELLAPRKPRHVRVLQQVRSVALIAAVRDIETDLVQRGCPLQAQVREWIREAPGLPRLPEKIQHRGTDALCLGAIDMVAVLHRPNGALAGVLV